MKSLSKRDFRPLLRRLDERERDLRRLIAEERALIDGSDVVQLADPAGDDADRADARTRAALGTRIVDRHVHELEEVAAARQRIVEGAFGYCVECGEAIDRKRLQAVPFARRCVGCQTRRERLGDR